MTAYFTLGGAMLRKKIACWLEYLHTNKEDQRGCHIRVAIHIHIVHDLTEYMMNTHKLAMV